MRTSPVIAAVLLAASARAEGEASGSAPAPASTEKAAASTPSAHLAAAQRLYQKLDLDAALAELAQAEAAAKDNEDETVAVLVYRGLIYSDQGRQAEATDQFKRALAIRPWAEVPSETSPRIAKLFSDARRSLWGMASVKPPKKAAPANAQPASTTQTPPNAQPAVAPGK